VHLDASCGARFRIPSGRRRRDLDYGSRDLDVVGVAHDDVASRCATRDMEPQIARLGDIEREVVVVFVSATDENLEAFDDERAVRAPLAAHESPIL
jgi:hypothetical protein